MSVYATYSIKDLEQLTHVKSHTIRIWEKRYGILQPERSDTNIRRYSNDDLKKLLNISFLNEHGYKISKIVQMTDVEIGQKIQEINFTSTGNDRLIENLIVAMLDLNEVAFQKALNTAILRLGFVKSFTDVVFVFFDRIGLMWQTGTINPAQEHFVSNIVRNKIIAATESLEYHPARDAKKIILLLPEAELHEIGLLLTNYMLRVQGFDTTYLGQAVPLDTLPRVIEILQPDYLICSFTNAVNNLDVADTVLELSRLFANQIFISGIATKQLKLLPENVNIYQGFEALRAYLMR